MIRDCPKLSGKLSLRSDSIKKEDLIAILTRWKELKVLRAVNGNNFDFNGIKFANHPNIRQIVVSTKLSGENFTGFPKNSPSWFHSSEVILDPQVTPKLVNCLQSLNKSKISPDYMRELMLTFFSYDLDNLDIAGLYAFHHFFCSGIITF